MKTINEQNSIYDEAIEHLNNLTPSDPNCERGLIWVYPKDTLALLRFIERAKKVEELLGLYKELSTVRFYLFCETDADLGQELMNKDDDLNKQIKQLEEELK
jgi:hypothetical protein